jgi:predicted enzyme related to lactoylglutathione lyase
VLGIDPDAAETRARAANAKVVQPARDFPHGWREVMLEDPEDMYGRWVWRFEALGMRRR